MDGGAWYGSRRVDMTERLHFHFSLSCIGEGNGNPLQCYCLENPRDQGGWWAAVYGVSQSRTQLKWLRSSSSSIPEWFTGFPYFLQFKSEFWNFEIMIWATVSSWSCFCWPYRISLSLAAKNIISLIFGIDHQVTSMCRVFSCVVGRGCLLWTVCSLGKTVSLCPASSCIPRPNLPVTPGISWLPTFAFQSPIMKRTSFLGVSSRRPHRSS